MSPEAIRVLVYLLKNSHLIANWKFLFEKFTKIKDNKKVLDKLRSGDYGGVVQHWMWEIRKKGTFDDCFDTREAQEGYKLKDGITFCLIYRI
jgi:hypothetical protein